jgi:hypothetical protein
MILTDPPCRSNRSIGRQCLYRAVSSKSGSSQGYYDQSSRATQSRLGGLCFESGAAYSRDGNTHNLSAPAIWHIAHRWVCLLLRSHVAYFRSMDDLATDTRSDRCRLQL